MTLAEHAAGIAALADPTRRRLYEYVVAAREPVGREQAATALELSISTVGFHLDKLVAEGLLATEFRRLTGRSGPGAGRPAKLYRRGEREFAVALPARRYDLVGEILASAYDEAATGVPLQDALSGSARSEGVGLGEESLRAGATADLDGVATVLTAQGFEAHLEESDPVVDLANCPFDSLARRHTDLVCGLNRHFVQGVADGLGCDAEARLEPEPGRCCVKVHRD
jgi:predicted ArsR family transcriptional regulator